jgi:hypothetical protein
MWAWKDYSPAGGHGWADFWIADGLLGPLVDYLDHVDHLF